MPLIPHTHLFFSFFLSPADSPMSVGESLQLWREMTSFGRKAFTNERSLYHIICIMWCYVYIEHKFLQLSTGKSVLKYHDFSPYPIYSKFLSVSQWYSYKFLLLSFWQLQVLLFCTTPPRIFCAILLFFLYFTPYFPVYHIIHIMWYFSYCMVFCHKFQKFVQ